MIRHDILAGYMTKQMKKSLLVEWASQGYVGIGTNSWTGQQRIRLATVGYLMILRDSRKKTGTSPVQMEKRSGIESIIQINGIGVQSLSLK
jgi:hypothetical protein